MTMLTAQELTQLRADVGELLPDTCDIERSTVTISDSGNESESWSVVADDTPCRVDPVQRGVDNKGIVATRESLQTFFQLTVGWNVSIQESDRVRFGSELYEIIQVYRQHSNRIVKRAQLALIQGA